MNKEEINKQIRELQELRDEITKEETEQIKKELRKLEWTKGVTAKLFTEDVIAAGVPKYKLLLFNYKDNLFDTFRYNPIQIFGEHDYYGNNICVTVGGPYFSQNQAYCYTQNGKTMKAFLEFCHFDNVKFDEETLEIYETCKRINKAKNENLM